MRNYSILIQRLSSNKTIQIINRRKNFVYFEKLLILRNILLNKNKTLNLKKRSHFYIWKRVLKINPTKSFERKVHLRSLINKKIKNEDYLTRLIRRAFYSLMEVHITYSDDKNYKYNENNQKAKCENNDIVKKEDKDSKLMKSFKRIKNIPINDIFIDNYSNNAKVYLFSFKTLI